ncbi:MAG: hypothetical protein EZS28_012140, partial [Streblomastix strix]
KKKVNGKKTEDEKRELSRKELKLKMMNDEKEEKEKDDDENEKKKIKEKKNKTKNNEKKKNKNKAKDDEQDDDEDEDDDDEEYISISESSDNEIRSEQGNETGRKKAKDKKSDKSIIENDDVFDDDNITNNNNNKKKVNTSQNKMSKTSKFKEDNTQKEKKESPLQHQQSIQSNSSNQILHPTTQYQSSSLQQQQQQQQLQQSPIQNLLSSPSISLTQSESQSSSPSLQSQTQSQSEEKSKVLITRNCSIEADQVDVNDDEEELMRKKMREKMLQERLLKERLIREKYEKLEDVDEKKWAPMFPFDGYDDYDDSDGDSQDDDNKDDKEKDDKEKDKKDGDQQDKDKEKEKDKEKVKENDNDNDNDDKKDKEKDLNNDKKMEDIEIQKEKEKELGFERQKEMEDKPELFNENTVTNQHEYKQRSHSHSHAEDKEKDKLILNAHEHHHKHHISKSPNPHRNTSLSPNPQIYSNIQLSGPGCRSKQKGPRPLTLRHHGIACCETCGVRPSMEDAVLLLPCGGWDIEQLVQNGEVGTLKRLLKLQNELRFSNNGMKAAQLREERIWWSKMFNSVRLRQQQGDNNNNNINQQNVSIHGSHRQNQSQQQSQYQYYQQQAKQGISNDSNKLQPNSDNDFPPNPYYTKGMQGCGIYGVFDGHRGPQAANFIAAHYVDAFLVTAYLKYIEHVTKSYSNQQQIPGSSNSLNAAQDAVDRNLPLLSIVMRDTFDRLNRRMRQCDILDGSCAIISIVTPHKIFVANVGDSRAVLVSRFVHNSMRYDPGRNENNQQLNGKQRNQEQSKMPYFCPTQSKHSHQISFPQQQQQQQFSSSSSSSQQIQLSSNTHHPLHDLQLTPRSSSQSNPSLQQQQQQQQSLLHPPQQITITPSSCVRHPIFPIHKQIALVGKPLTIDNKPQLKRELQYIKRVDGFVSLEKRVNGILAVARSLGDFIHSPAVSADPDLYTYQIHRWSGLHIGPQSGITKEQTQIQTQQSDQQAKVPYQNTVVDQSLAPILDQWLADPTPYKSVLHPMTNIRQINTGLNTSISALQSVEQEQSRNEARIETRVWDREDIALVMACDGLFDVVDNQLLAEVMCPWMEKGNHDIFNDTVFNESDSDSSSDESQQVSQRDGGRGCFCSAISKGRFRYVISIEGTLGEGDNVEDGEVINEDEAPEKILLLEVFEFCLSFSV